jgi:hypothetical protein
LTGTGYNAMSLHQKNCTLYQKRILKEEADRKPREGHSSRYTYVIDRIATVIADCRHVERLLGNLKTVEANAELENKTAILHAREEAKEIIEDEIEKRYQQIEKLLDFTRTLHKWYHKIEQEESKEQEKEIATPTTATAEAAAK